MEWQVVRPDQIVALAERVAAWPAAILDLEATGVEPYLGDKPIGIGLGSLAEERQYYLPLGPAERPAGEWSESDRLNPLDLHPLVAALERLPIVGHNVKYDLHMLALLGWCGEQESFYDVMVLGRIWSKEDRPQLGLKELGVAVLGYDYADPDVVKLVKQGKAQKVPTADLAHYCCEDVWLTRELYLYFKKVLPPELLKLFAMECRVSRDLFDIEQCGQLIDQEYLQHLAEETEEGKRRFLAPIHAVAGENFNPRSAPQKQELMKSLGIAPVAWTPTGAASWDKEALLEVRGQHPVALELARYNSLAYIESNMIERCRETVAAGFDALHGTWIQTAVTGRLRSGGPNRQNDPHGWLQFGEASPDGDDVLVWVGDARAAEREFSIERLFVARPGHVLFNLDYRQIEMYVLGFYMDDPVFNRWLASGNVHAAVAAEVWGDAEEFYERGKTFNFAMVYGTGDEANARRLKRSLEEVQEYRRQYFARMPGYPRLMRKVRRKLARDGCLENVYGRTYWLEEDRAYVGVNYLCQGSAGDFVKFRLPATRELRRQAGIHVLKTTHDDFTLEVPRENVGVLPDLLRQLAESPFGRSLEMDVEWSAASMVEMRPWNGEVPDAA